MKVIVVSIILIFWGFWLLRRWIWKIVDIRSLKKVRYGFIHPYAGGGGGGERVLWELIVKTLDLSPKNEVYVYMNYRGRNEVEEKEEILRRFGILQNDDVRKKRVKIVMMKVFDKTIQANYWSSFLLLGQFIGSILLTIEALLRKQVDVWVDTTGLPGGYFFVWAIMGIPIIAYVHYPMLQNDMFQVLKSQRNKSGNINKFIKHKLKFVYWKILYELYVFSGRYVSLAFTNGTWTNEHMKKIWGKTYSAGRIKKMLPLYDFSKDSSTLVPFQAKSNIIVYLSQFRTEKRHILVLHEYRKFVDVCLSSAYPRLEIELIPQLSFLGSCSSTQNQEILSNVKAEILKLNLLSFVKIFEDLPYKAITRHLSNAKFALNAMWNEHFGISIVEYMFYGAIPICHASGGPYLDILVPRNTDPMDFRVTDTGFFFKSELDPDYNSVNNSFSDGSTLDVTGESRSLTSFPSLFTLFCDIFATNTPSTLVLEKMSSNCVKVAKEISLSPFSEWSNAIKSVLKL